MKYQELIDKIDIYEREWKYWDRERYLDKIEQLRDIQRNLRILTELHLTRVFRPFLADWGRMYRIANRQDIDWKTLARKLQSLS